MNKTRVIPIFNQVDVHAARMYTREAARQIGMELIDQARVSLATSSLAGCLKMFSPHGNRGADASGSSQISIQFLEDGPHPGILVKFTCPHPEESGNIQQQIEKVRSLVDEVTMEDGPAGTIQVILIKWGNAITQVTPG